MDGARVKAAKNKEHQAEITKHYDVLMKAMNVTLKSKGQWYLVMTGRYYDIDLLKHHDSLTIKC